MFFKKSCGIYNNFNKINIKISETMIMKNLK